MQFLTADESRAWSSRHGYHLNESFGRPIAGEVLTPLRFHIPPDAGARVTLARTLWETAGADAPEVLVWVTEWSIWPSGEHMALAEAARRGLGAKHTLSDSPGHVTQLGESDSGLSILCLAVLFLWDCWVLPADGRPAVFISHDEFGVVDTRNDDRGLRRRLEALGLVNDSAPASNERCN
ncbi:MAG: hypothetical protein ACJ78I_10985 [Gemmatimonadaceae bacterium]